MGHNFVSNSRIYSAKIMTECASPNAYHLGTYTRSESFLGVNLRVQNHRS
jgi:hypothetical protein